MSKRRAQHKKIKILFSYLHKFLCTYGKRREKNHSAESVKRNRRREREEEERETCMLMLSPETRGRGRI